MKVIYSPSGRAEEYSELAANLYNGCGHGCEYCYAASIRKIRRAQYFSPSYVHLRKNVLKELKKDAKNMAGDKRPILFSFLSDPYQPLEKVQSATREALSTMAKYRLRPQILTKAGTWSITRDKDVLQQCNGIWAATLTTDCPDESRRWEPQAALPEERIQALQMAKEAGLETWVSFEPVFNTAAVLRLINRMAPFVDEFKVGKLNYHPRAKEIDWIRFRENVVEALETANVSYYIKNDLRKL